MGLTIINDVRRLIKFIYNLDFPENEKYGIENQIKRAVISVALNIREGNEYQNKQRVHFFNIALGSLAEVDECINIIKDLTMIDVDYDSFMKLYWLCRNKLLKLKASIPLNTSQHPSKPLGAKRSGAIKNG